MKAASYPLDSVQRPPTVFGVPQGALFAVGGGSIVLTAVLASVPALPSAAPLAALLVGLPGGLIAAWRARARDHHVETVLLTSARFWRGQRSHRVLAAGGPAGAPAKRRRR